jgi:membrane fusion protein (multidrug efflux system)
MENQPKKSTVRTILVRIVLVAVLGTAAWYGFSAYRFAQSHETTDNAQIETNLVPVLPRMAGYVRTVAVRDYDQVRTGQLLVEIDDAEARLSLAELEATYQQLRTDVENARASLRNAELIIKAAGANLQLTKIRQDKARKDAARDANLLASNAITRKQADESQNNLDVLNQQYVAGDADLAASRSRLNILRANLHKAEAALGVQRAKIDQQKLRLTYAKVFATSTGKIGRKSIEPGQFIQAGQPLMTIVQDSTFWVVANFKESQLENLHVGDAAEITVDAYPDRRLTGRIASFSEATGAKFALLPPDNASGNFVKVTQKVPVKIELDDVAKLRDQLRAGMSVEVTVKIK